ncbi:Gfo/Idh/MocA family protein [Quadrisphaera sp. DSM 44207]|uniref:Gfo/Idh/MocA family protein n=1 Tax=Quadrisphaera sp. DSM 44207 TaxID=1881057 RepID=UPI00088A7591|nr:Gfo/Idh/MocA family oxidoreductase [Quadrisphaera sp. DSM 44207]SDQ21206.1 Predicted dehydrogenase [Quadrisphaera sp. DSM 44207]
MGAAGLGVAVIGAGMAGRAHAQGYRTATSLYATDLPPVRLVAIADAHEPFARDAATRYGYERAETSWQAVAQADDVDVVSVVVANHLHREVVEGLLGAGKHVLCEKPLAPSLEDARAMVAAAQSSDRHSAVGFTFRRSPAIAAVQEHLASGALGRVRHFNGHYWCDYAVDPGAPMSWRYRGGPGSGALADVGSHAVDLGEFVCGPVRSVSGAVFATFTPQRPVPLGAVVGHAGAAVSDELEAVENEDVATFTARFAGGAVGTFSVSRATPGLANGLGFEVTAEHGTVGFDLTRPAEFSIFDTAPEPAVNGFRQVLVGPQHPYLARGLAMDFPSVGHGQNDLFVFQARCWLDQVAGLGALPPLPGLAHGLHNLEVLDAVARSAAAGGESVEVGS